MKSVPVLLYGDRFQMKAKYWSWSRCDCETVGNPHKDTRTWDIVIHKEMSFFEDPMLQMIANFHFDEFWNSYGVMSRDFTGPFITPNLIAQLLLMILGRNQIDLKLGSLQLKRTCRLQCMACGPAGKGRCFGSSICCGDSFGCFINTDETSVCRKENYIRTPCFNSGVACGINDKGVCAADGVCCTESTFTVLFVHDLQCVFFSKRFGIHYWRSENCCAFVQSSFSLIFCRGLYGRRQVSHFTGLDEFLRQPMIAWIQILLSPVIHTEIMASRHGVSQLTPIKAQYIGRYIEPFFH